MLIIGSALRMSRKTHTATSHRSFFWNKTEVTPVQQTNLPSSEVKLTASGLEYVNISGFGPASLYGDLSPAWTARIDYKAHGGGKLCGAATIQINEI